MKKIILKFKILITNISRIIMSFLFVNLRFSFDNKVFGFNVINLDKVMQDATCYFVGPVSDKTAEIVQDSNVDLTCYVAGPASDRPAKIICCIIILVPVVIALATIIHVIKKKKKKKNGEKKDAKKN